MREPGKIEARIVVAISIIVLGVCGPFSNKALQTLKELIDQY